MSNGSSDNTNKPRGTLIGTGHDILTGRARSGAGRGDFEDFGADPEASGSDATDDGGGATVAQAPPEHVLAAMRAAQAATAGINPAAIDDDDGGGMTLRAPGAPGAPGGPPARAITPPPDTLRSSGAAPPPAAPAAAPTPTPAPVPVEDVASARTMMSPDGGIPAGAYPAAAPTPYPPPATTSSTAADRAPRGTPAHGVEADAQRFIGKELGGYRISEKLAEGGMGVVYIGEHTKIGKKGAIKLLKLEYCQDEQVIQRFYQEARSVNEIRHENIVDVFDFGRDEDGRVFFVMELLEGEPLDARLRQGPVTWNEGCAILDQTIRALKAAHDKGFVHRDLKPENIFLRITDSGGMQVKLLDFGIAKLIGADNVQEQLTRTGAIIGTPHYMSPEQIDGKGVDARSDIYSLGVVMYEMFSGKRPFGGQTLSAVITGHLLEEPPPMTELSGGVPLSIEHVVRRMLAKNKDERYQSVTDVLSDLKDVASLRPPTVAHTLDRQRPLMPSGVNLRGPSGQQPAQPAAMPQPPRKKRSPALLIGAIAGALVLAFGVGVGVKMMSQDSPATVAQPEPPAPVEPPAPPPLDFDAEKRKARALIVGALGETEPQTRVHAVDALADVKDRESAPKLLALTGSDPDAEVRGHSAVALAELGASAVNDDARAQLAKLSADAEPALKVWYADALARLGDDKAMRELQKHARDKDLAVSYKAAMALARASKPGDRAAIGALTKLATREAEMNDIAPYAGVTLLASLTRLGHDQARKTLYKTLEHPDEGARLAAAEALARIGDDTGKEVLTATLADDGAPPANRVVAARVLVELGDYSGYELLEKQLASKDAGLRRTSARGLGAISEKASLRKLLALYEDPDMSVRIAAAAAVWFIIGLDPVVLAQASVDWAQSALASEDWAVRQAAARTLGDIPEDKAVPLLAQAIADPDPKVRRAAARSASRMKTPEAAAKVAAAVATERDPEVKEQQVIALGAIKSPVAKEALQEIADENNRIGVMALGSLVAIGAVDAADRLATAGQNRKSDVRLAAMQSAALADNKVVVPTLQTGVTDRVFDVRFAAAEGLAKYQSDRDTAVKVLEEGLAKPAAIQGRAQAALFAFGVQPEAELTLAEMLADVNPDVRLAAIPAIGAMKWDDAQPLLRRAIADTDHEVKAEAVDAIGKFVDSNKGGAIRLYKLLIDDDDAASRAKAKAQLSRLVEAPAAKPVKATNDTPPAPAPVDATPVRDALARTSEPKQAFDQATAALDEALAALEEKLAKAGEDSDDTDDVLDMQKQLPELSQAVTAAAESLAKAAAAVTAAENALGATSDETRGLVAEAEVLAQQAKTAIADVPARLEKAAQSADDFLKERTLDPEVAMRQLRVAISAGNLASARSALKKAERAFERAGRTDPEFYLREAEVEDMRADKTADKAQKLKLLKRAKASYEKFLKRGSGRQIAEARDRVKELTQDIAKLEAE